MKPERVRSNVRPARLVAVLVAPLLALGAAAAPAQNKKVVVQLGVGELSQCGASPNAKTISEKKCLRGRVRTVMTEARMASPLGGGLVEGALYLVTKETYDERGNLTLTEISDSGNGPGPIGVVFRRGVFSYDEQGRMTSSKWYEAGADEPASAITYSYDEHGNRVKIDSWRTKPDDHLIIETFYDAAGREVGNSSSRLTPDGWKTSKSKKVVTVEGELTVARSYSLDGKPRGRTEILKDERGHTLSEELYEADARGEEQLRWKVEYRYDRKGFLTETIYHKADASLGARAVYEYNDDGNCISLARYNADGSYAVGGRHEYEYDAAGNWVVCVDFSRPGETGAPVPYNLVRRQITYY